MPISKNQTKLLWTGKSRLNLSDGIFRTALVQIGGLTSVTELEKDGFEAMFGLFEYMGFAPLSSKGKNYGDRPGMASFKQIERIRVLWQENTYAKVGEDELNKWLERGWKISSLRFLRKETARRVITALKAMNARAA